MFEFLIAGIGAVVYFIATLLVAIVAVVLFAIALPWLLVAPAAIAGAMVTVTTYVLRVFGLV